MGITKTNKRKRQDKVVSNIDVLRASDDDEYAPVYDTSPARLVNEPDDASDDQESEYEDNKQNNNASDDEDSVGDATDEDDDTQQPPSPVQAPKKKTTKPTPDRFDTLQAKTKKRKTEESKRDINIRDLKADLKRPPALILVSSYTDIHMNSQFSKKFNHVSMADDDDDEDEGKGKKKTKRLMNFVLTDMPHTHFMDFPVRSAKISDMTEEETQLFDEACIRFNDHLVPQHVSTMQLYCPITGKILDSKHVMFDRSGNLREWTTTQAKILCSNHPQLMDLAKHNANRRPATLKQCISLDKTKSGKPIDWHSNIIPSCYYTKMCKTPLKPTPKSKSKSPPSTPKPKPKPKVVVETEEKTTVSFTDTDWDVVMIRTYTEQLLKNSHTDGNVCASLRERMAHVKMQFKLKDSGYELSERDIQWLLFGYLVFSPDGYKTLGSSVLQRPRTTGKAPLSYTTNKPTSSKRPSSSTKKRP